MEGSKLRTRTRQRLRKQVAETVDGLPPRYVLEAVAGRLGLKNGWLEVRVRDGFVQYVNRTRELNLDAGVFPTGWTQADVDSFFEEQAGLLRQYAELTDIKLKGEQLRSIVTSDMFTAAQLLEREPKPNLKRMRGARVEE